MYPGLTACGKSHAAFERRCIPAETGRCAALIVAFRSEYTRYSSLTRLVSRAPHRSRCSRHFLHRLLTACGETHAAFGRRSIPAEPRRFAPLIVALRSKYTRYSSLTRLVSRAPRPHREDWPASALTWVPPPTVNRVASRRSSLRFGRNTPGIPPSRALSAGPPPGELAPPGELGLAALGAHVTLSTNCSRLRTNSSGSMPRLLAARSRFPSQAASLSSTN